MRRLYKGGAQRRLQFVIFQRDRVGFHAAGALGLVRDFDHLLLADAVRAQGWDVEIGTEGGSRGDRIIG